MNSTDFLKLYLVSDRDCLRGDFITTITEAVRGGVSVVQLREKYISDEEFVELGKKIKKCLADTDIPLIINDRVGLVKEIGAEGVHLGQTDMGVEEARRLLGESAIIGLSVENEEQTLLSNQQDVNYVAVSPVFSTTTKTDTAPAVGIVGLRRIVELASHPVIGIGGINEGNIKDVMSTGACGVAVVSAIMGATDPCSAAQRLKMYL